MKTAMTMHNRELFQTDPGEYRLANQGVAKISFPPTEESLETIRGELSTFVCDGAYGKGLCKILEGYLGSLGKGKTTPAVWISGFYGSGKSHLASMLAALWTNFSFPDGATAEGLIQHIPDDLAALLKEFRVAATRFDGVLAAGDTLGTGPSEPAEATLAILLRSVGLPTDLRAAQVALWLADLGILEQVQTTLGKNFDRQIRNFILDPGFAKAVLEAKPELADNPKNLSEKLRSQFPEPPPVTVDLLETMGRQALMLGRKEIPLTLIVLDEVQQFIRQDPSLTLKIQTIAERLSSRFDGKVLLVATGQQALSDVSNLQKLLDRFPIQIALGEADVDAVIRKTVLRKKPNADRPIKDMLEGNAGEISRHLRGSRLAHTVQDDEDAILDWPLLPSRRRVWEKILRELDRTGLGGTLRGQLRTTLDAAKNYADKPLGHAVPVDFLYGRFANEAYNANLLSSETRNRIEALQGGQGDDMLRARILMIIYMLGRIAGEAEVHGVYPIPETIADLLTIDLAGEPELRRKVPELLDALQQDGAVIEVSGQWRLQTKESAEWEAAYRSEQKIVLSDQSAISRERRDLLGHAIENALSGVSKVPQGNSKVQRTIHRLHPDDKTPADGVPLRLHNGWDEDLKSIEKEASAAPSSDATIHLLVPSLRSDELNNSLAIKRAANAVLQLKGVPQTTEGQEAQKAMLSRVERAESNAREILLEAVTQAKVIQSGGQVITGKPADAIREAATNALARLYPKFADADHPAWGKVFEKAQKKDPDAIKLVDHSTAPEDHPVCKQILQDLGPGMKGSELRNKFTGLRYGWSQDAVDGALAVLANAGIVRVTDESGKLVQICDIPRSKIGPCTFRAETTVITVQQRLAVRGLLSEAKVQFTKDQEAFVVSTLLDRLEEAARRSGGDAPAPAPDKVPDIGELRSLSGNDLVAKLAELAPTLREKLQSWQAAEELIQERLSVWQLAEQLVRLGAEEQAESLAHIKEARTLLANPDPLPPIIAAAAEMLRSKLNGTFKAWDLAGETAEKRLEQSESWNKLNPEQQASIRQSAGLLSVTKPAVATPKEIEKTLSQRGLSEWDSMTKALSTRVDDALAEATAMFEPKARTVQLPSGLLKSEAELDDWLKRIREQIASALAEGPVTPKV
jgi:hypothetical protein